MKSRSGEISVGALVMIALAIAAMVVGYVMYTNYSRRLAHEEQLRREEARVAREKAEAERRKSEEEAERERVRQRQERERAEAERDAKRQAERKERELAAEESRRKLAEKENRRRDYLHAKQSFDGIEAKIAIDEPAARSLNFPKAIYDGWCILSSFDEDGKIYCITNDSDKVWIASVIDGTSEPKVVDKENFASRLGREKCLIRAEEGVMVFNAPRNGASYAIPEEGMKFVPAAAELSELYGVIKGLGVTLNDIRCRLTLKSKDGKQTIPVGITGYEDSIGRDKLESLIGGQLIEGKRKSAQKLSSTKGPALKKFRRTVVFYDGEIIKKGMGTTYVPRTFVYHGTTRYHDDHTHVEEIKRKARAEWEKWSEEAKRQEQKAAEIEVANQEAQAQHQQRQQDMKEKMSKVDDNEIEQELSRWTIQVERGKSKQKK